MATATALPRNSVFRRGAAKVRGAVTLAAAALPTQDGRGGCDRTTPTGVHSTTAVALSSHRISKDGQPPTTRKNVDYERSCPTHWPVGAYARTGARKPYSQNGLFLYAPLAQVLSVHAETRARSHLHSYEGQPRGQQKVAEERCGNYSDEMI